MLKKNKNILLELIKQFDFDLNDFLARDYDESEDELFEISIRNTPLKFIVRQNQEDYGLMDCRYNLFGPKFQMSEYMPPEEWGNIHEIYRHFSEWLRRTVTGYFDEITMPDLWAQLNAENSLFYSQHPIDEETSFFSQIEKDQIKISIKEFNMLVCKHFNPSKVEADLIENRLEYLSDSVDRLNRLDWKGLAISTVLSISIAMTLDTEKGNMLFQLFKKVFAKLLLLAN